MKKFISVLLLFSSLVGLFSCGKGARSDSPIVIEYLYNTGESHQAVGEYLQSAYAAAGITVNLTNQEWGTFLHSRKLGEFTLARNGWIADYSDPISFLDIWISESGNNDVGFGRGEHKYVSIYSLDLTDEGYDIKVENGTWSETYDVLIKTIKSCTDEEKRYRLMHLAEDMIMQTGCITPLYFYTDVYMKDEDLLGFFSSALGYKFFKYCTFKDNTSISVSLASEPESIDPALNSTVDGATMISHLFAGLAKWDLDENGNTVLSPDLAEYLPSGETNEDGSITYVYTLRDDLYWSDGKMLTANDFEFAWRRASSSKLAADYAYMFDVIKGYGTKEGIEVHATDDKTLTVILKTRTSYWNELLAFPAFMPVREDVVTNEAWATDAKTYISNGAYVMSDWTHNGCITLTKNERYYDAESITMPKINFFLSDDANNMLTNFKNGSWQLIDTVPTEETKKLMNENPRELIIAGQLGTYYLIWNINVPLVNLGADATKEDTERANQEIRRALSLLIDRNYIADEIGMAGQVAAASFVPLGMKNPDGSEFSATAGNSEEYQGYFDVSKAAYKSNVMHALEILRKYFKLDIPT